MQDNLLDQGSLVADVQGDDKMTGFEAIPDTIIQVGTYIITAVVSAILGWYARKSSEQKKEMVRDAVEIAEGDGTVHDFIFEHVLDGDDDDDDK